MLEAAQQLDQRHPRNAREAAERKRLFYVACTRAREETPPLRLPRPLSRRRAQRPNVQPPQSRLARRRTRASQLPPRVQTPAHPQPRPCAAGEDRVHPPTSPPSRVSNAAPAQLRPRQPVLRGSPHRQPTLCSSPPDLTATFAPSRRLASPPAPSATPSTPSSSSLATPPRRRHSALPSLERTPHLDAPHRRHAPRRAASLPQIVHRLAPRGPYSLSTTP